MTREAHPTVKSVSPSARVSDLTDPSRHSMSESTAIIKTFFSSLVAQDCSCEYTTSDRSGG